MPGQNPITLEPTDKNGDLGKTDAVSGFVRAADGTHIFYESWGTGKPLVFCYGLTCRREHWRHQLPRFGKDHRIITLDYRGHHASGLPKNDRNLTLEWCAKDLHLVLKELGVTEWVGLGHSLGVPILVEAAAREENRPAGLILIGGTLDNPFDHFFFTNRMNVVFEAHRRLYDWFPDGTTRFWRWFTAQNPVSYFLTAQFGFNPERSQEKDIRSYLTGVSDTEFAVFLKLLEDLTTYRGEERARQVDCPVMVVAGEDDCIVPFDRQQVMAGFFKKASLVRVPEGSHNPHTDFPELVNSKMELFLKEVGF